MSSFLEQDVKFLAGVGPKRAELLAKEINVRTVEDLLYYFPFKHIDRTKFYAIRDIKPIDAYIQTRGRIKSIRKEGTSNKERLVALLTDNTGTIPIVFFKGVKYLSENIRQGNDYVVFGKPTEFNGQVNFVHPEMESVEKREDGFSSVLQAHYSITERLRNNYINSRVIARFMVTLWKNNKTAILETLTEELIINHRLLSLQEALFNIHFPQTAILLQKAQQRLKFEELFWVQLRMLYLREERNTFVKGYNFSTVGDYFNLFFTEFLPFELTKAQKRVIREIRRDTCSGKQMNRLLQGDVGSGKTLVALMVMLIALDNGFQACLMAPTEILAAQHLQTITGMLEGMNIHIALLTGSTKKKDRRLIHEDLTNGSIHIIIGTHALIEETVQFANLGLVVIDEQHRFGVAQRARLWRKNAEAPHVLVMTATPIPRTLAMTLYGDLEVSVIDELPPGRKQVKTAHYFDNRRKDVFEFMRKQIEEGRQIYVVYPLISESEKMDYKDLEMGFQQLRTVFPEGDGYSVIMVHGRMSATEKELAMRLFKERKAHILVATTVIEVGVDVPNASVMVIESAERFGLSQLHQLRGRVGRGADQSFCILLSSYKLTSDGRNRLQTMVSTTDGFAIAEADLRLRGPGDIDGTQQSGAPFDLRIASLATDGQLLQLARQAAAEIIEEDPGLNQQKNMILKNNVLKQLNTEVNWSKIS